MTKNKNPKYKTKIEILKCNGCGRYGLGFTEGEESGGLRITNHKCAGSWTVVKILNCEFSQEELDLYSEKTFL